MHVEFTFFEWLTLYFWAPRSGVESSTPPQLVPENHWRNSTVKFPLCILKTVQILAEFTIFEWLTLYFWASRGSEESTTQPQPVSQKRRRTGEVSTLYLENCANACWIYVFWVINPLFLSHTGYRRIADPFTTCPGESLIFDVIENFNSVPWKL